VSEIVEVVSDAAASPFEVEVSGTGYLIDPAFPIPGGGALGADPYFLIGLVDVLTAVTAVWQSVVNADFETQFDCEDDARIVKLHNFNLFEDKTVKYFWFHYEDLGVAEVTFTFMNQENGDSKSYTRTVGAGTLPAGRILKEMFEITIEGENILVQWDREGDSGTLSVTDYGFRFLPSTEMLGTFANPLTLTPAYIMGSGCPPFLMFGLIDTDDEVTVHEMDPEDWDTDDNCIARNSILLPFQTEQGPIPGFTYEKFVARVFFHYEDYGVAVVRVTVSSLRDQFSTQDVTIGTVDANRCVQLGIADLAVTDEVVEVKFERVSGAICIIDYTIKYENRGQRVKASPVESLVGCDPPQALAACVSTLQALCIDQEWTIDEESSYTLSISGGTLPYHFELTSGPLPDGITFDEDTGEFSGTPTEQGTFPYTVKYWDSGLPIQIGTLSCEIVVGPPTEYEVPTGLQFLISEDQDETYIYAGTNGFYVPAQVLRFLKSTGELDATLNLSVQGSDAVCDLKSDETYLYARYSYSILSVVRIRKSDFTVVDTLTFAPKTANANPSIGQMWVDEAEGKLYVPAENVGTGFAAVWKIDLATFTSDGHLDLPNTPPTTAGTNNGIAGAVIGDATDIYVGISNQHNFDAFSADLYPALLFKLDKASFTVDSVCFYPGIFSIIIACNPQIAMDATHIYAFGPGTTFGENTVLYKFEKADITTVVHVDLTVYTNSSYVDCLYIDATYLYFQDDVDNDLMTLLLSDFATTAVVKSFAEQCSMFVFDATSYYEFMNGLIPNYSTLFKFPKT
jgi:hypothetical protein